MNWISVKDKLPNASGDYLCVVKGIAGGYYRTILSFALDKDSEYANGFYDVDMDCGYIHYTEYVSYWMPLPEMPDELYEISNNNERTND